MHKLNCFVLILIARVSLLEIVDRPVVERFHNAARSGNVNVVVDMLCNGVPIDCCNKRGETALWLATANNRADVAGVLLEGGANVNWKNNYYGRTPLIIAAMGNSTDVMKVLLHHRADRSIMDVEGKTALDWARWGEHKEVMWLLEKS